MTWSRFFPLIYPAPSRVLQASRITGFPAGHENSSTGAEGASRYYSLGCKAQDRLRKNQAKSSAAGAVEKLRD